MKTNPTSSATILKALLLAQRLSWRCVAVVAMLISFISSQASAQNGVPAVIDDSDGYTNIRAAESKDSRSIGKVLDGERFTVFPNDRAWWRISTSNGTDGFMHRSCIRLLSAGPNLNSTADGSRSIRRDETTATAWSQYMAIREAARPRDMTDRGMPIAELEKINLANVDPAVAAHIRNAIAFFKYDAAIWDKLSGRANGVEEAVTLRENLRPIARVVGSQVLPEMKGMAKILSDLALNSAFSDSTAIKGLPDRSGMRIHLKNYERLVMEEALIDGAFEVELSAGLKRTIHRVQDRAVHTQLQTGRWILRGDDNSVADLEFATNPTLDSFASGFVTIKWRQRNRSEGFFQYEFCLDGKLRMKGASLGDDLAGPFAPPPKVITVEFTSPDVMKLTEKDGSSMGTWERISARERIPVRR